MPETDLLRRVEQLDALAHPQRLAIFRLLVRRYPDALAAGEIVAAVEARQNTVSSYLNALRHAGLIRQTRRGRSLLYRVDMQAAGGLVGFLVADCCRGRPDLCPPLDARDAPHRTDARLKVLFVCTGNSARSLMAEALLRREAGDRFEVQSAGTHPRAGPNPAALDLLRRNGHDVSDLTPKSIAAFRAEDAPAMDFVITVCDRAANEECPALPGSFLATHWGVPDPAAAIQRGEPDAFDAAYTLLERRIRTFAALPVAEMRRRELQTRIDDIAMESRAS